MHRVTRTLFGRTADGEAVTAFTLSNGGMEMRAIDYGGIITSLVVPDRAGRLADVVLGYDTLDGYLAKNPFFGALVGRCANRLAHASFVLDGREYRLAANDGPNHLHGGVKGFDKVLWHGQIEDEAAAVTFTRTSPAGEEGYPGALEASVRYALTGARELIVEYRAVTDRPTIVNLSQHSYFNLAGAGSGDILSHELTIHADRFTPVDDHQIPTGELAPVAGTPFDFRRATPIGERIGDPHQQLRPGDGYDHNFVLAPGTSGLRLAARLADPRSGRTMEVATTHPGLQFYSGNRLDGSITGKEGHVYPRRAGVCLETQHFPNAPHHPHFPSIVLRPGDEYRHTTVFAFGTI